MCVVQSRAEPLMSLVLPCAVSVFLTVCPSVPVLQYIKACVMAKENPHLTLVHTSTVEELFKKEITAIGAVVNRKTSNPPLPLPPKRRGPSVSV